MFPSNDTIERTKDELSKRDDLALLRYLDLEAEIDADGTAWVELGATNVGVYFHCQEGWYPHVNDSSLSCVPRGLCEAIQIAHSYVTLDRAIPRTPAMRCLDAFLNHSWPQITEPKV